MTDLSIREWAVLGVFVFVTDSVASIVDTDGVPLKGDRPVGRVRDEDGVSAVVTAVAANGTAEDALSLLDFTVDPLPDTLSDLSTLGVLVSFLMVKSVRSLGAHGGWVSLPVATTAENCAIRDVATRALLGSPSIRCRCVAVMSCTDNAHAVSSIDGLEKVDAVSALHVAALGVDGTDVSVLTKGYTRLGVCLLVVEKGVVHS